MSEVEQPRYAIVEIMGHRTHAGIITEVQQFGAAMMRIECPKDGDFALGVEVYHYGGGSIFSYRDSTLEEVCEINMPWERRCEIREQRRKALPAPDLEPEDADWSDAEDELPL